MSLWPPDRLLIGLYPDRLQWLRHDARQVRRRGRVATPMASGQPRWAAAVAALTEVLATARANRARATIVLSNHFVRYTLVPWTVHAADDAQRRELARHGLAQIYGSTVDDWSVQVSDNGIGAPMVASAVDTPLLTAIDAAAAAARVRIESVQPFLMTAFNRFHSRLRHKPQWFALVEPGALCLALCARGRWRRLLCRRGGDWAKTLASLLRQEACLGGAAVLPRDVLVYAPGMTARPVGAPGEWRVRYLSTPVPGETDRPARAAAGG